MAASGNIRLLLMYVTVDESSRMKSEVYKAILSAHLTKCLWGEM